MSLVERRYQEGLDAMSGMEKVERTASLFGALCEMLSLQISRENSGLSPREIQLRVAERLYSSDSAVMKLLYRAGLS